MSKAAELAALIGSQTALSNRNFVINGAMQISQRATSVTGIGTTDTSGTYHTLIDLLCLLITLLVGLLCHNLL